MTLMTAMRRVLPAVLISLAPAEAAHAAAWTLAPGAGFASFTVSAYEAESSEAPKEIETQVYGEYGALDGVTLGGFVELKADRASPLMENTVAVSAGAFVRMRILEGAAGDPFSIQVGAIGAASEPEPATGIFGEETSIDARLLYGRGFGTDWGDVFVNAEWGLRWLLDGGADEVRLDLTAGWRPDDRWLVLVQSFGVLGLRNPEPFGSDYDSLKLALAAGYRVGAVTMLMGVEQTVTGRNVDRGTRFRLSVWRPF